MRLKYLILFTLLLFIASSAFLFDRNSDDLSPEKGKNWWTASFVKPDRNKNIDVVITNYSESVDFRYEILVDNALVQSGEFQAPLGGNEILLLTPERAFEGRQTTVRIIQGDKALELFRKYK